MGLRRYQQVALYCNYWQSDTPFCSTESNSVFAELIRWQIEPIPKIVSNLEAIEEIKLHKNKLIN